MSEEDDKYFTTSDYNKFMSNVLDAKITQEKLVNESDLRLTTKEEIKALATNTELKAEQDKIVKLQTYDLSLFIVQSYFQNNGAQLYLIFQPIYKTFTIFYCFTYTISVCEYKRIVK